MFEEGDMMNGSPEEFSIMQRKQEAAVKILQLQVSDWLDLNPHIDESQFFYRYISVVLLRFLETSNMDIDSAFNRVTNALTWRATHFGKPFQQIIPQDFPSLINLGIMFFHGKDYKGRRVLVYRANSFFPYLHPPDEFRMFVTYMIEKYNSEYGHKQITALLDLTGFSLYNMSYMHIKEAIYYLREINPSFVGCFLILNAPGFFKVCWAIIKPWIPAYAIDRIHFVSPEQIVEFIAPGDLIRDMGGISNYIYRPEDISK